MRKHDDWHLTDRLDYSLGRGDPFAAAVRATRMAMIVTNPALPDNPIVFANDAFLNLTGYSREEVLGRNCRFLQGADTDRATLVRLRESIAKGQDTAVDLLNYRKDGSSFWNALYISPVRDERGEIAFFFASQLDVSARVEERRRIERQKDIVESEVLQRTAELEAALTAKIQLLDELDHRVKNNLAMIGSFVRMQARTVDDERLKRMAEATMARVETLSTVHRRLYNKGDVLSLDIGEFTQNMLYAAVRASGGNNMTLRANTTLCEIRPDIAPTVGVVIGELVQDITLHAADCDDAVEIGLEIGCDMSASRVTLSTTAPGYAIGAMDDDGLRQVLIRRLGGALGMTLDESRSGARSCLTLTIPVSPK
ncbi:PAS domain-containing protein [Falsirhodobacter sp. alg1]|uniref:PAS domain-containing protein n=1 Tax=Falsirhodobacter sp. alg1 TaxID=1472418 RepID=UPI00178D0620|nr:PAS domain-containing protein [Falsirhodobacter sp. alg1]